jgi:DNA-binding beta-propeller fold protein YncE
MAADDPKQPVNNKRKVHFMGLRFAARKSGLLLFLLHIGVCLHAETSDAGKLSFEVERGWPSLPNGHVLGFVTAVDVDSHGHIYTFHSFREWQVPFPADPIQEPTILMWSGEGTLLKSWGAGLFRLPHGLSIDDENNVWVTDVALNQVFKFSHEGELELVLGEAGIEGWDEIHFAQPADVEFGPNGTVYVADGYVNCRIMNFSKDGEYRFEWGECGNGAGQFDIPHDLEIDAEGKVYVADRENDRVQIFSSNGQFIKEWRSGGTWRPYGIALSPDGNSLYIVDGGEQPSELPDRSGVVILDHSGRQIGRFGRFGNQDGQFMMGHDIALGAASEVYVVDVIGQRLQRFLTESMTGAVESDELAIETTYDVWVKAANEKDITKWSSFLAENPYFSPPDVPPLTTSEAILEVRTGGPLKVLVDGSRCGLSNRMVHGKVK